MLAELKQMGDARAGNVPLQSLRHAFGDRWQPDSPSAVLDFAMSYCQALLPHLSDGTDVAGDGVSALFAFLANLPRQWADAIGATKSFPEQVKNAWSEPAAGAYVSLCATVHDVWAHVHGPEAEEDSLIAADLTRAGSRTALDFGAGAGHFAIVMARQGIDVDVVEVDEVKLAFLLYRAERLGLASRVSCQRTCEHYDLVVALNVLDHLQRPAEALASLIDKMSDRGRLFLAAEFPSDDWHQSEQEKVESCATMVWQQLQPAPGHPPRVPWYDVLIRRQRLADSPAPNLYPCLHPAAELLPGQEPIERVLAARRFYVRPCRLNEDAAELLTHLDGSRTASDLADELQLELAELFAFCEFLRSHRQLIWLAEPTKPSTS